MSTSTTEIRVSTALLAGVIRDAWPWPEDTTIAAVLEGETEFAAFSVNSATLPVGATEVCPLFRRDVNGIVSFDGWEVWR